MTDSDFIVIYYDDVAVLGDVESLFSDGEVGEVRGSGMDGVNKAGDGLGLTGKSDGGATLTEESLSWMSDKPRGNGYDSYVEVKRMKVELNKSGSTGVPFSTRDLAFGREQLKSPKAVHRMWIVADEDKLSLITPGGPEIFTRVYQLYYCSWSEVRPDLVEREMENAQARIKNFLSSIRIHQIRLVAPGTRTGDGVEIEIDAPLPYYEGGAVPRDLAVVSPGSESWWQHIDGLIGRGWGPRLVVHRWLVHESQASKWVAGTNPFTPVSFSRFGYADSLESEWLLNLIRLEIAEHWRRGLRTRRGCDEQRPLYGTTH